MTFMLYFCITLFIAICIFLILIILVQKGRGGGLASAFGGSGGNTAFGSKTGDVLTWVTAVIFGIFILLAVVLNLLADRTSNKALEQAAANTAENIAPADSSPGTVVVERAATTAPATTAPAVPPAR